MLDAASQTCFTGSESNVRHSESVRGGPLSGDFWSRIRLWKAVAKEITRNRCLPARAPVGGERTASCAPARGPVARGPVGGERTESCVPARGPVGGERTAFSMLPRRFRDSRRLEALLKGRKRKTGRARRCFTDLFYLFRAIFGLELDCGKLWRRKSLGTGVYQPEDPWEVRERLLVHQPEDPWPEDLWEARERLLVCQPEDLWEVRERLFRCFRGVSVTAGGLQRG